MIIAAEASSAHYALKLMLEFKKSGHEYEFFGVGSDLMEQEGFERFGKSEEMAVVGAVEILKHLKSLKKIFNKLVEVARERKPQVVILMDYPEFNLKLAEKLKPEGLKVFYYISPQIWAWRQGRVETIRQFCEKVFLLFPFEVEFYKSKNVAHEFVGHPLLEDLDPQWLNKNYIQLQKEKYGITPQHKVLALMPGSRRGELDRHFEIQLEVARRLLKKYDFLRLAILVAPTIKKTEIQDRLENFKSPYLLLDNSSNQMIAMADYVLVASGTATLMVGLLQKPMVIMYRMNWLTGLIAKALVRGVRYFGLVNLILGREVVPERMQSAANVDELEKQLERYILDQQYTEKVIHDLQQLPQHLGEVGATARVAQALTPYLK